MLTIFGFKRGNIFVLPQQTRSLHVCITAIGNPEKSYGMTRHNAGIIVLGYLKDEYTGYNTSMEYKNVGKGDMAKYIEIKDQGILLLKNIGGYMNHSGRNIVPIWRSIDKQQCNKSMVHVVVHDELSLPLGKVQLRDSKSSLRGHNGLKDIAASLGNQNFQKLAIGIGRPTERDPKIVSDYVLGKFSENELSVLRNDTLKKVIKLLGPLLQELKS